MPNIVLDGTALRQELDRAGVSQRALAKYLGVEEADVSRACNGHAVSPEFIWLLSVGLRQMAKGKR
jgi:plasmid maintenance system antidote protein VapI